MKIKPLGIAIIAAASLAPLIWFIPIMAERDAIAAFSQYLGSAALILMAFSQLIATRWRGVEAVFGPMDRAYVLHKWIGMTAIAAVLLHDTIDAEMRGLGEETLLSELAETLGEISLYALLVLIVLSIATFVPYRLWMRTHQFMGAAFALGAFHFIYIRKPFDMTDPLGLYVGAFCALGLLAYVATLLAPMRGAGRARYTVAAIEPTGGALAVTLTPIGRPRVYKPGQFGFLSFDLPGLSEAHPFTISGATRSDGALRVTIKSLGDYTAALPGALQPGAEAQVEGPYGGFIRPRGGAPDIWIAAGVGVTPFMAWAETLTPDSPPAHLFYCIRSRHDAPHLAALERIAAETTALTLHIVESGKQRRLDAARIKAAAGGDLVSAHVSFCGPQPMREALREGLIEAGLPGNRFHFEEFEIRSGVGLRKLAAWAMARFNKNERIA